MSKVKVLFLAANPSSTGKLALDEEIRAIDGKIHSAEYRDRLDLVSHWAVRLDDVSGLLLRHKPHVIHFSGHGSSDGKLVLHPAGAANRGLKGEDESGTTPNAGPAAGGAGRLPVDGLARLLGVLKDNVRVVVLNACYSEAQARAIVQSIDCAVGTSRPIRDDHAISFAAEFYQALAYGRSVREAYDLGVIRLQNEGYNQADSLLGLQTREGIDAAKLLLIGPPGTSGIQGPAQAKPVLDRMSLVRELGRLSEPDFNELVNAIEGAETRVSSRGTVKERVAELMRWAGSPTGPGLAKLAEVYEQLKGP
jgi:hypothetical protein